MDDKVDYSNNLSDIYHENMDYNCLEDEIYNFVNKIIMVYIIIYSIIHMENL